MVQIKSCILLLTNNAVRRLLILWATTVQRDVLIFALDVRVDAVLTLTPLVNEETEDAMVRRRIDENSASNLNDRHFFIAAPSIKSSKSCRSNNFGTLIRLLIGRERDHFQKS